MAERFKAAVLKTAVGASLPWVRIPLSPPVLRSPCFYRGFCFSEEGLVAPHIAPQRADMRIPNYLRLAPSGVWHFRRRLSSRQARERGKHEVTRSLGTRDLLTAQQRALTLVQAYAQPTPVDGEWMRLGGCVSIPRSEAIPSPRHVNVDPHVRG